MLLFHGTTTTDPRIIIDSDEGLDIRFNGKNATAYGKGIYFHQTASYSIGFAHQNARGRNREMLVAKVLVGDTVKQGGDSNRRLPPCLPGSTTYRYDSINDGGGMYISFTNSKTYPAYLISF